MTLNFNATGNVQKRESLIGRFMFTQTDCVRGRRGEPTGEWRVGTVRADNYRTFPGLHRYWAALATTLLRIRREL
jgi:hypothetical protein